MVVFMRVDAWIVWLLLARDLWERKEENGGGGEYKG
jgi:hypothetical protein